MHTLIKELIYIKVSSVKGWAVLTGTGSAHQSAPSYRIAVSYDRRRAPETTIANIAKRSD